MIGYNIETSEHLNDDGTYTLYYWAEPSKKDKVTGIKYSPFNTGTNGTEITISGRESYTK